MSRFQSYDLGTLPRSAGIDPPFAKLIPGSWFAKVVVMSERVMSERSPEQTHEQIRELLDSLYRVDSGRILATLIRLIGDFDLAEEAMHEAFAAAEHISGKADLSTRVGARLLGGNGLASAERICHNQLSFIGSHSEPT